MLYSDTIQLISATTTVDDDGYEVATETTTEVYADCESATRTEFYEGQKAGLNITLSVKIRYEDYTGQKELIYNSTRYNIERTYATDKDHIQLNCSEAVR